MRWNIRNKMFVVLVPPIMLLMFLSSYIVYYITTSMIEKLAYEKSLESARQYANQIDMEFTSHLVAAQTLTTALSNYSNPKTEEIDQILSGILESNYNAVGIGVAYEPGAFGTSGRLITGWKREDDEITKDTYSDVDNEEWYSIPKETKKGHIVEPSLVNDKLVESYIVPILKEDDFKGVTKFDISLEYLDDLVGDIQPFKTGYAFLTSNKGLFISYKEKKYVGSKSIQDLALEFKNAELKTLFERILQYQEGFIETKDPLTNEDVFMIYSPVRTNNWGLVIVVPRGEFLSGVTTLTAWTSSIGLSAIAVICVIVFFAAARLSSPIKKVADKMDQADLNTLFNLQRHDEIGDLSAAFDKFISSVRKTLLEVIDATAAVDSSAKQISVSTEAMSVGAKEQTHQTSNVTEAIEQMSKTVYGISQNANQTKELALRAQATAEHGSHVIENSVQGMNKMVEMVKQSTEVINSLSKSSEKIDHVVNIIDDVTRRVNLIAINAAIEATKAGDKGKGFAVVADEIKKLSERTSHFTTEISETVTKIQHNIMDAVNLMRKSNDEADVGIQLAHQAQQSLKEISEVFQNVTLMVSQIAVSAQEQTVTSNQITDNTKMINNATQQVADGILEIAKSAEYLNKLTSGLQKLITRFKLQ